MLYNHVRFDEKYHTEKMNWNTGAPTLDDLVSKCWDIINKHRDILPLLEIACWELLIEKGIDQKYIGDIEGFGHITQGGCSAALHSFCERLRKLFIRPEFTREELDNECNCLNSSEKHLLWTFYTEYSSQTNTARIIGITQSMVRNSMYKIKNKLENKDDKWFNYVVILLSLNRLVPTNTHPRSKLNPKHRVK